MGENDEEREEDGYVEKEGASRSLLNLIIHLNYHLFIKLQY